MNSGGSLKAAIPAWICLLTLVYCTWALRQSRNSYFPPGTQYKVDVTVTGPDGESIPAVAPAPR